MTLTSPAFRALTIAAAVLATAITAALWNQVRGRRTIRTLARLGLLMVSYVLTAIAVLVSINIAYGGLISSWGDLFDNLSQGPPHQVRPGHSPGTAPAPHSASVPPGAAFRPK
jgi:hypothetical protein